MGLTPWRLVAIAVLVLFFRRLPIVVLLKPVMPAMKTYREAIFSGWFGPMGVGAVFLSTIAKEELTTAYEGKETPISIQVISPVVLFIVFCSVLVHGTTIPLFKLGKRIRTRTLSITSISSNQVLRLPKLQFGQQLSKRSDEQKKDDRSGMTELERNTLFNTLQHDHIKEGNQHEITIDVCKSSDSESDLAEEDFLPDDVSDTLQPNHHANSRQDPVSSYHDPRRASAVSLDTQQAIRFLEPVKPRVSQSNPEKNENNTTGLKNWLLRSEESEGSDGHGIKNLFKRRTKDHHTHHKSSIEEESEDDPNIQNIYTSEEPHLNPRIQVWEEDNHIVIEDSQNAATEVVIDKKAHANWKKQAQKEIKHVEQTMKSNDASSN